MLKVRMIPRLKDFGAEESGIKRVVEAYYKYLPEFDIQFIDNPDAPVDITVSHASAYPFPEVVICHGLYWTSDYPAGNWEWSVNQELASALRQAKQVTVPSTWVAETFQRDMRLSPTIVPHGIEWKEWQHNEENGGYVLWNKNRDQDVCSPHWMNLLAEAFTDTLFISTFSASQTPALNVRVTGVVPHDKMKGMIQRAGVYLSTTKETFGIGVLEAMASGVPVLGFRYGGNVDLIQHGVTGYLANPNDMEDLKAGLDYCVKFRSILGENAREAAKEWSWLAAAEKMAGVFRLAALVEPPTVSIIIPCFNYAGKVGRAIESALGQSYPLIENVIIVDDGSTDSTKDAVSRYLSDKRVKYIYQNNRGVANARNAGIASCSSKYVVCLDADDAIHGDFVEVCVRELEKDRSLGIAYTGLWYIKPDGSQGQSPWPGEFDYDAQLKGNNQIPTCCVFRRKMWERLGGYDQRYAPGGAGEEDAEFWLRAGAYGFNAKRVTGQPLFIYSWMSGRVSGKKDHVEVDWLSQHPWTKDNLHPFASMAKARHFSHAVRQYDEPNVSVITPVGKGHERTVRDAIDSVESQTFRRWEHIIVNDTGGPLDLTAYPYLKVIETDRSAGAGAARNLGASIARAPFLLFLDADDMLYPEAVEKMLYGWSLGQNIIYSDYVGKAFIDPKEIQKFQERVLYYDEKTKEAVLSHKSFDYDCDKAIAQPNREMYIWSLITSLVPKGWHDEIGGFDEKMVSWEDWDYWIRMARAGRCFYRLPEPLVVYRFYTGNRRERGLHDAEKLIQYLLEKYKEEKPMGCGCGNQRPAPVIEQPQLKFMLADTKNGANKGMDMSDDLIVLALYTSLNIGGHRVIGAATGTDYGYRAGGEKFLVDRRDVEVQPNLFTILTTEVKPPVTVSNVPEPPTPVKEKWTDPGLPRVPPPETKSEASHFDLQLVPGVTGIMAMALNGMGVHDIDDLLQLGEEGLMEVKGIGAVKAKIIIDWCEQQKQKED